MSNSSLDAREKTLEAGVVEFFVADQLVLKEGLGAPVPRFRRAEARFRLDDIQVFYEKVHAAGVTRSRPVRHRGVAATE